MRPHSLVDPGNPPHSPPSRAKAHPTRQRHRMVALAARASGRRTKISPQTKITTVVLARPLLLRLVEISQVGLRLVFLGRHQEAVPAEEIVLLADTHLM